MKKLILFFPIFLLCSAAVANQVLFGPPNSVTVTATSTQILPQNGLRTYLIIQNTSASVNIIVKFGSVQTATEGIIIPPGGNYEPISGPSNSVFMETPSSTATATVIEGQ